MYTHQEESKAREEYLQVLNNCKNEEIRKPIIGLVAKLDQAKLESANTKKENEELKSKLEKKNVEGKLLEKIIIKRNEEIAKLLKENTDLRKENLNYKKGLGNKNHIQNTLDFDIPAAMMGESSLPIKNFLMEQKEKTQEQSTPNSFSALNPTL